jgi:membrane protein YqaA with SNARE-associated domain
VPSYFSWFLSPVGALVLAAFDSSVAFFLPLANDTVVVYLAAGNPSRFWVYPVLSTIGSVIGCATTYWLGALAGEDGIERWVPAKRLDAIRRKTKEAGAFALAVPAIIPPPFPFTPFVLASGALEVNPWKFFPAIAAFRFVRFMAEGVLARIYGRQLLSWMNSGVFRGIVWGFVVLAIAGSAWSIYALIRRTRGGRVGRSARPA